LIDGPQTAIRVTNALGSALNNKAPGMAAHH
jgi:hypothetical protein